MKKTIAIILSIVSFSFCGFSQNLDIDCLTKSLDIKMKAHLRIFFTESCENTIKDNMKKNQSALDFHNFLIKRADEMLTQPVAERQMYGMRLLTFDAFAAAIDTERIAFAPKLFLFSVLSNASIVVSISN